MNELLDETRRRTLVKTTIAALLIPISIALIYSWVIFKFGTKQLRVFGLSALTVVLPLYLLIIMLVHVVQKRLGEQIRAWVERSHNPDSPEDIKEASRLQWRLEALPVRIALLYAGGTILSFGIAISAYGGLADFNLITRVLYFLMGAMTGAGSGLAEYFLVYDGYRAVRGRFLTTCRGFPIRAGVSLRARLVAFGVIVSLLSLGFGWVAALEQLQTHQGSRGVEGTASLNASFLLLVVVLAGTIGFITYLISRNIVDPVRGLALVSRQISKGDLSADIPVNSMDDLGELASSYDNMLVSLSHITGQAQESAEWVAAGAESLSASTEQINSVNEQLNELVMRLSANMEEEVRKIERINEIMDSVVATMQVSHSKAEQGAEISVNIERLVEEGRREANEAVREISKIYELITASAAAIQSLDERSSEVTMIVDVIADIADQTNLLALNAAIEAARAKEYGRGFAVVADEVKKLSEESNRSAQRISVLIRGMRQETENAVEIMTEGAKRMAEGTDVVSRTDRSLGQIAQQISRMADISRGISDDTQRESEASQAMAADLSEITKLVESNSAAYQELGQLSEEQVAAMQEVSATAQELAFLAERLDELVKRFKLREREEP